MSLSLVVTMLHLFSNLYVCVCVWFTFFLFVSLFYAQFFLFYCILRAKQLMRSNMSSFFLDENHFVSPFFLRSNHVRMSIHRIIWRHEFKRFTCNPNRIKSGQIETCILHYQSKLCGYIFAYLSQKKNHHFKNLISRKWLNAIRNIENIFQWQCLYLMIWLKYLVHCINYKNNNIIVSCKSYYSFIPSMHYLLQTFLSEQK